MLLLVAACAEPSAEGRRTGDSVDDGETAADSDTADDIEDDTGSASGDGQWGPTEGELPLGFLAAADITGSDRLETLVLTAGAGTFDLGGIAHTGTVYLDHDWPEAGYHLYDLISIATDGSAVGMTYLYESAGSVPYAYTESYTIPMDWEVASGSLLTTNSDGSAALSLPALRALPPPLDVGIVVDGVDIQLNAAGGTLTLDGVSRAVHPFGTVDCSGCPGGPWLEVHSVLAREDDACFAILYLFPEDPTFVQVEHGLCLPSLKRLSGAVVAGWSGALREVDARRVRAPIRGVPPRRRAR